MCLDHMSRSKPTPQFVVKQWPKKRGKEPDIKTVEDYEQDTITLLTICSVGWRSSESNTIKFKGEELVFNVPNVKRVLTDMPWIRNQLNEFISELENFMTC